METTYSSVGRRITALAALIACGSVLLWAATKGPDAGGYTATDETVFSFVDISGSSGGSSLLAGTDDGTATLTLPFPLRFYGQFYTLACVSTNGALYFVPSEAACSAFEGDFANTDISATAVPHDRPAILPLWMDLTFQEAGAGSVLYQTLGDAPNRRFVIQWNRAYPLESPNPVTFQVILKEGSGRLLFQYQSVDLGTNNPASGGGQATVGIRDAAGATTGKGIQWSYRVPVLRDHMALAFSNTLTPTLRVTGGTFVYDGQPHRATATATGVNGEALVPITLTYDGQPDAPVAVGTYAVVASLEAAGDYESARAETTLTITRASQTIGPISAPATAAVNTSFTVSATASSGLPVSFDVSGVCSLSVATVTMTASSGTCSITASRDGNDDYIPATPVQVSVTAVKAPATVTLSNLTPTYTGSALTPTVTTVPAGLAISWTNAPQTVVGTYTVTATITDTDYQGSATGTFTVVDTATPGNMHGDGFVTVDGVKYQFSFQVSEDAKKKPNNRFELRIDYDPKLKHENYRLVATTINPIVFSDAFASALKKNEPPIDTVVFSGTVEAKGDKKTTTTCSFTVNANDLGEPGKKSGEVFGVKITGGSGCPAVDVHVTALSGGNIQSNRVKR